MIPHYLLTNTFYGNWLPGDPRGFVSSVRDRREGEAKSNTRKEHDQYGTEYDKHLTGLYLSAKRNLKCDPILLTIDHAEILFKQLLETSQYRQWPILALAIMVDHIHVVIQVPDDANKDKVLGDLKAYGTRSLNKAYGKPPSDTWWTHKGSMRRKYDEQAIRNAILYTLRQENPLILWACDAVKAEYREFIPACCK
jgi:REP element-mobilizing transposase RayT